MRNIDNHIMTLHEESVITVDPVIGKIEKFLINTDLQLENNETVQLTLMSDAGLPETRTAKVWLKQAKKGKEGGLYEKLGIEEGDDVIWLNILPKPKAVKLAFPMEPAPIA